MSIIRFILTGDAKGLDDAAKKADSTLKDLRKEFREGVNSSAKWSAAMAAAGAAISAHLINKSLQAIDTQAKLARTLDTTVKGLEITTRAAALSGVALSGVEQATKDLTRRLSQAASGSGPAADALERLHLTASELQALPLDERIATINKAIDQFIPKAQQAAVAGQLFGEEGSLAMRRIDSDTLAAAAADVERFGSALSEVDAAKVEAANDAMARVGQVVDGLVNRFTAELSPVLTAISNQFLEAADAGDELRDGPGKAFDAVVKGAAFAMDAVEGVKRTFEVAGQAVAVFALVTKKSMLEAANAVVQGPVNAINKLVELVNKLPGEKFDLPKVEQPEFVKGFEKQIELSELAVAEGWAAINATLQEPLPGGQFLKFVEEARAAGEAAAEAAVAAREKIAGTVIETGGTGGGGADYTETKERLEALRESYQTELQDLQAKFGEEQQILADALELKLISESEYRARLAEVEQEYQDESSRMAREGAEARKKVTEAEAQARMRAVGGMLSDLSTLMNAKSREMFEVGKAAAIGNTIISTYESAQKAYSAMASIPYVGPALGIAAAAAAVAAGTARVQAIRSQSFGGAGTPQVSNTQAVNAASTPVGGGAGEPEGASYTLVGIDPSRLYSGRELAAMLQDYADKGGKLPMRAG